MIKRDMRVPEIDSSVDRHWRPGCAGNNQHLNTSERLEGRTIPR